MKTTMAYILSALVLLAGVGLFAPSQNLDIVLAQSFSDLKKEYNQAKKDGARSAMKRILPKMADTNDPKAAKFMLKELESDQKARKNGDVGLPGEVRSILIESLASFTDEKSVESIGKAALKLKSDKNHELALDQFDFFLALAEMKESESANKTIRAAIADKKNPFVKIAAIEAVRQASAKRFIDDVCKVLEEDNKAWRKWHILPVNVFACLKDLIKRDDKENVYKAIEAAIVWEMNEPENSLKVYSFAGRMLQALTGESAGLRGKVNVIFWKWWVAQMKLTGMTNKAKDKPKRADRSTDNPIIFNSIPVGNRFVFVIDTSDSMKYELKITIDELKKEGPTSGHRKKDKEKDEEKDKKNPLEDLPWEKIETKMDLARFELSRAVKSLADAQVEAKKKDPEAVFYFAIVTYSTEVECMTKGFLESSKSNCDKWAKKALDLEPDALTNIHGGIMQGMRISANSTKAEHPSVDENCIMSGADTIIFLTDGWATWDDESEEGNKVTDTRNGVEDSVGDGPYIYGDQIWPDIIRQNIFRKVVISTLGIGNHDKELMRKLAEKTGGTYTDWYFDEKGVPKNKKDKKDEKEDKD